MTATNYFTQRRSVVWADDKRNRVSFGAAGRASSSAASVCVLVFMILTAAATRSMAGSPDTDGNGYIDEADYKQFHACMPESGLLPESPTPECLGRFDADDDDDIDLMDFADFARSLGHLPIPLRDTLGAVITVESTAPYSGRQTCGTSACHDVARITNGLHFQQGRTDAAGNLQMGRDIFNDGRYWHFSRGRYGRWFNGLDLTNKDNSNESEFGMATFDWVRDCMGCHPGGGPGEFDRDGALLYNAETGEFGYEVLGKSTADVALDGDYAVLDLGINAVRPAPWDVTGLLEPDCLFCHREDRVIEGGVVLNHDWRAATIAAAEHLVDTGGQPVPAFAAAGTAGQGWFSTLDVENGVATALDIDYAVGVANGSLLSGGDDTLSLAPSSLRPKANDMMCARCHFQTINFAGVWFDERDVHYKKFNRLNDEDPTNDIPPESSTACSYCHPGDIDHNFAKGDSPTRFWRDELDWVNFRSCRECHLTHHPDGSPNPLKHPEAPDVPGTTIIHNLGFNEGEPGPMAVLACEACHIPYGVMPYTAVFDSTVTGAFGFIPAALFYSADPLDPTNPDKSRWYPPFVFKTDSDGEQRLFPAGTIPTVYWGDWDQNGTPEDLSDDTIAPIIAWRVRQVTGGVPFPGVIDDNGDGLVEVNHPAEMIPYFEALKGNDSFGRQVAANPVLVKSKWVWHEDANEPGGVNSFAFEGTGIAMETWTPYIYGVDHNVLVQEEAWGYDAVNPELGCRDCHRPDTLDSPVFDRLVLIDPCGIDGQPVYKKVRELTGLNPP